MVCSANKDVHHVARHMNREVQRPRDSQVKEMTGFRCETIHQQNKTCPANGNTCRKCDKLNHFQEKKCANELRNTMNKINRESDLSSDELFVCTVNAFYTFRPDCAIVKLQIGKTSAPINFKIDTGSQYHLIPQEMLRKLDFKDPKI
jgi:hypothetical protein